MFAYIDSLKKENLHTKLNPEHLKRGRIETAQNCAITAEREREKLNQSERSFSKYRDLIGREGFTLE